MLFSSRSVGRGCPVCGSAHTACGPPTTTKGVDERMETVVSNGGELKLYDVTIGTNKTQMRLNDTDAAFYQEHHTATLAEGGDSGGDVENKPVAAKARTAANKLGGAENKSS
jgi:hypothetical protein